MFCAAHQSPVHRSLATIHYALFTIHCDALRLTPNTSYDYSLTTIHYPLSTLRDHEINGDGDGDVGVGAEVHDEGGLAQVWGGFGEELP